MERGVVYLGHIPHGFYEQEMHKYFSQFGRVTRLKLSRSKKTGRSKGFAFIEFECSEVAQIVAETMHNYLMFNKLLKCHVVPAEDVHPGMFITSALWKRAATGSKAKSPSEFRQQVRRLKRKDAKKRRKLKSLGVQYEFPGYVTGSATAVPHITKFTDSDSE